MKNVFIFSALIFASPHFAQALMGPLLKSEQIPPQLCRIMPTAPQEFSNVNNVCSAIIVGRNQLLTAGHCGYKQFVSGRVDCYGGDTQLSFQRAKMTFPDPENIINPIYKVTADMAIHQDLAIIETDQDLTTPPIAIATAKDQEAILAAMAAGQCLFAGVGYNSFGPAGLAHAAQAPAVVVNDVEKPEPIFIKGQPHVAGHDSGGGFLCPGADGQLKLAGTLVAQKGKGSVIAHQLLAENQQWLATLLAAPEKDEELYKVTVCEDFQLTTEGHKLLTSALEHISHFEVVRKSMKKLSDRGLSYCATGMPLEKDIYKNYRYLAIIEVRNQQGDMVYHIPTLYLSPSVQADHNVGKKPWTALNLKDFSPNLEKLMAEFAAIDVKEDFVLAGAEDLLAVAKEQPWWSEEAVKSFQFMKLGRQGEAQFFVGGWMENQSPGATLFAQFFAPQAVVFKYEPATKQLSWTRSQSSFANLLVPASELLEQAALAEPQELADKVDYFLQLGQ